MTQTAVAVSATLPEESLPGSDAPNPAPPPGLVPLLLTSILIVSTCAIVYELLISSLSSYLLGNSVLHFSLTIGLFMFFMGVGSYLSRFVYHDLLDKFVSIEIAIGGIGGFSAALLYLSYSSSEYYYLTALLLIAAISTLVGLEIPIVTRIVKEYSTLREALSDILAFDYVGALLASVLFPLVLVPYLGLMRTAFLVGALNVLVGVLALIRFRGLLGTLKVKWASAILALLCLTAGFACSFKLVNFFEHNLYQDEIIYAGDTPYQRIVLTKFQEDLRLYLNGNLQFSSADEYRYHESLVRIPLSLVKVPEEVLILGGGDGLAARELLKDPRVKHITLVDLDPQMVELSRTQRDIAALNQNSLRSEKVKVVVDDAFHFVEHTSARYGLIIIDLPDPNDLSLGKLYTKEFYRLIDKHLAEDGVMVTQASSPYFSRTAFWCIHHTIQEIFPAVAPYWAYIPSFGPWGFVLAGRHELRLDQIQIAQPARFLTAAGAASMFVFDPDMAELDAEVNRLDNQVLVRYYEQSLD